MSKGIIEFIKDLYSTKFILPIFLFLGFIYFYYFDLDSFFSWNNIRTNYSELSLLSAENILYSAFIFFLVYFLATDFSLPVLTILSVLGGVLFGWLAVLLCILSGTIGCWVVFFITRGFLFEYLSKKANPYISSITTNFNKGPFIWLLSLKLFPLLPMSVGNIVPGVLGMKSSTFLLAAFLGAIPSNLIYVSFGKGISRLITDEETISLSIFEYPDIYITLICLLLISMISFVIKFLQIKRENY